MSNSINGTFNPGRLEVIVGTMFSGKSKSLLERGLRAKKWGGIKVYYFKPFVDTRDQDIKSRDGMSIKTLQIKSGYDLLDQLHGKEPNAIVIIDETQFFDESILFAVQLLQLKGFNIIVGGLDKDYRGQPFPVIAKLMAQSDISIHKLFPVCSMDGCVEDGSRAQRLRNGAPDSALSPTVVIENHQGEIEYRPVCRSHHIVPDLEQYIKDLMDKASTDSP